MASSSERCCETQTHTSVCTLKCRTFNVWYNDLTQLFQIVHCCVALTGSDGGGCHTGTLTHVFGTDARSLEHSSTVWSEHVGTTAVCTWSSINVPHDNTHNNTHMHQIVGQPVIQLCLWYEWAFKNTTELRIGCWLLCQISWLLKHRLSYD